jgi:hypothetical protein
MIPLKYWKSYLKNIYESPIVFDNISNIYIEDEVFSVEDINFGVK